MFSPRVAAVVFMSSAVAFGGDPYAGPTGAAPAISRRIALADFRSDFDPQAPRQLRLVLREAVTLTDIEKQGIKGGGGVRIVPVTVYGNVALNLPIADGRVAYADATGEIVYLGANRIGFKGPLQEDPASPLSINGSRVSGTVVLPVSVREPGSQQSRDAKLNIVLDLEILNDTFAYTPDPDPSIPPWRSDKSKPNGRKVTGTWRTVERRPDVSVELEGKITGSRGSYAIRPGIGRFFPIQATALAQGEKGLRVTAYASPKRVDAHDSQWAVKQLETPLDLREFNGLRLVVDSAAMAGTAWKGAAPVAVALAVRIKGDRWYSCRTSAPLLGGRQDFVADFGLFYRGAANPGIGSGANTHNHLDLSKIDAVAVGVANPFGVGTVEFEALTLEAVRYRARGFGEAPADSVLVRVNADTSDSFNGVDQIPKALFGYHLANASLQSSDKAPSWFEGPPIHGDSMKVLELCRPGSLRPLDHTNFSAETGASMVQIFPADIAAKADALDAIMTTITNENLWARPKWMDQDLDAYSGGIREMFRQVGQRGWKPGEDSNTLRRIEFWNEPFMWARHINRGASTLSAGPGDPGGNRGRRAWEDPTQFYYMPGRLGGEIYAKFFNAAAEGLAETNPHVEIGGMSSGCFGEDFCSQLTNYVDYFLRDSHPNIDFLTEHHYSGNPVRFAADYEIVSAWALAKYGRTWPVWNTEANDLDDVAPGDRRSVEAAIAFTDRNRAYYNYRDIAGMIRTTRDIAAGRAIHALWGRGWFRNEGEYLMYRHTAGLRGTLVVTESNDEAILPLASWENGRLVIVLLNDSAFPRTVRLELPGLSDGVSVSATALKLNSDETAFAAEPRMVELKNGVMALESLSPFEILTLEINPVSKPSKSRHVQRSFSDLLVRDVAPGSTVTASVAVPRENLEKAGSAWLRIIFRDTQTAEVTAQVAGGKIAIPATASDDGQHRVIDLPLPVSGKALSNAWKDGALPVTFHADPKGDGFTAYALGLVLEEAR